jgi:hypothetical protein
MPRLPLMNVYEDCIVQVAGLNGRRGAGPWHREEVSSDL